MSTTTTTTTTTAAREESRARVSMHRPTDRLVSGRTRALRRLQTGPGRPMGGRESADSETRLAEKSINFSAAAAGKKNEPSCVVRYVDRPVSVPRMAEPGRVVASGRRRKAHRARRPGSVRPVFRTRRRRLGARSRRRAELIGRERYAMSCCERSRSHASGHVNACIADHPRRLPALFSQISSSSVFFSFLSSFSFAISFIQMNSSAFQHVLTL